MAQIHITLIVTFVINTAIGITVLMTNYNRNQNRFFFIFSLCVSFWALCVLYAILSPTEIDAFLRIRLASYAAVFTPPALHLLCIAVSSPNLSFSAILNRARTNIMASQLAGLLCFTPSFLKDVKIRGADHSLIFFPEPEYGIVFVFFNVYFILSLGLLFLHYIPYMLRVSGTRRTELQFILLGMLTTMLLGITTNIIIPSITGRAFTQPLGPLSIIAMNFIIAYGIATQRIMNIADVLRKILAYGLLTCTLVLIYIIVWFIADRAVGIFFDFKIAHLLAALSIAFSMAPAYGLMQRFATRLFIHGTSVNIEKTLQEANNILQSVSRLEDLLSRLAILITRTMGTDRVYLLLQNNQVFEQKFPEPPENGSGIEIHMDEPLATLTARTPDPLVTELLARRRPTPELSEAHEKMQELGFACATGIRYKESLAGIILLGPRMSGGIYGTTEQEVLKMLGNQLGVAIENAKLYTEIQENKIYQDILVDNMVNGVIAANVEGIITVFNREAQRITNMPHKDVIEHPVDVLPPQMSKALRETLDSNNFMRNLEIQIARPNGENMPVRIGTTVFHGREGNLLGALLVCSDLSEIKKLEKEIRRSDRLASLGTLSAGMAHEIKNPLVSIKTFTDLLPHRYEDPDFRETFSKLIGQEVERIDGIVNQLLGFSRPTKATLEPVCLHETLDKSIRLLKENLSQKDIALDQVMEAGNDRILGDPRQLQQAFINFFMNAIDAMNEGGCLTIYTSDAKRNESVMNTLLKTDYILVSIRDTGHGIPETDRKNIFDPFFTTKSHGTGLGLAVAHGIINEHGGRIEVESDPGKGTIFNIFLPLALEEAAV